jgi:hypothetical protein
MFVSTMRAAKENRTNQGRRAAVHRLVADRRRANCYTFCYKPVCSTSERDELPNGSNVRAADLRGALEAARKAGVT